MVIKKNEAETLAALVKLAEERGNPMFVSTNELDVKYWQSVLQRSFVRFKPTRQAKLRVLRKLQEKGLISLNYEDRFNPKIRVEDIGKAKKALEDAEKPKEIVLTKQIIKKSQK